jgi:hypothetical protein
VLLTIEMPSCRVGIQLSVGREFCQLFGYVDELARGRGLNQTEKVAQRNLQSSGEARLEVSRVRS